MMRNAQDYDRHVGGPWSVSACRRAEIGSTPLPRRSGDFQKAESVTKRRADHHNTSLDGQHAVWNLDRLANEGTQRTR
jgi:hypothetical protein